MRKLLSALSLSIILLASVGCSVEGGPAATPGNPALAFSATPNGPASFQSTTLPDHVEKLYGTALLRDSMEVESTMGHPHPEEQGSYFILVSSTNPGLGILVFARGATPQSLASSPSGPMLITGPVRTFRDLEFAQRIKARHSITLCSRGLDLQYISPEQLQLPAPLANPSVTPSPASGITPAKVGGEGGYASPFEFPRATVSYPVYPVPSKGAKSPVNFV